MVVSLAVKLIIVSVVCFTSMLIILIVTIVLITKSHEERNQNKSMILIYISAISYFKNQTESPKLVNNMCKFSLMVEIVNASNKIRIYNAKE